MHLGVLGAGSIVPQPGLGCAGYALLEPDQPEAPVTLLDLGPGTVRSLPRLGIGLGRVERVVLSHFHPDHCLDLFALAFARRNPSFRDAPRIELVGPPGLARLLGEAPATWGRWARDPNAEVTEVALDAEGTATLEREGLRMRCQRNGHSEELVTLSWRLEDPGGAWSLLYTGDTNEDPRVARLGKGVDVFLAECSFPDEQATANHLGPSSAARLANEAGARALLLSHFYPAHAPSEALERARTVFAGPVEAARDGSLHPLG